MASKKHAELIRAWLDGAQIQYLLRSMNRWVDTEKPNFEESEEFRIKPAEPERVYNLTKLNSDEIFEIWKAIPAKGTVMECLADLVEIVLTKALDAGQIVTREEFDRAVGDRKVRDLAVAQAVSVYTFNKACRYPTSDYKDLPLNFEDPISLVK